MVAVEPGYYNNHDNENLFSCDIASVLVINDFTDFSNIPNNISALKGYLFPPGPEIKSVAYLKKMFFNTKKSKLPLFIDATLPDPRMIYMASPSRLEPIEHRKETINKNLFFAAAFAKDMKNSESSESEKSDEEIIRSGSLQTEEIKEIKINFNCISDEETEKNICIAKDIILEANENDESTPLKVKNISKKTFHDIYDDLDHRIKACQQKVEDLCLAEKSTYSYSGSTNFLKPLRKVNSLQVSSNIEKSTESESSEPGSASTIPKLRRELFRPTQIIIKPETRPESSRDYKHYLANYPDH